MKPLKVCYRKESDNFIKKKKSHDHACTLKLVRSAYKAWVGEELVMGKVQEKSSKSVSPMFVGLRINNFGKGKL